MEESQGLHGSHEKRRRSRPQHVGAKLVLLPFPLPSYFPGEEKGWKGCDNEDGAPYDEKEVERAGLGVCEYVFHLMNKKIPTLAMSAWSQGY